MAEYTMSTIKLPLSFVRDQIDRLDGSVILEGPSRGKWRVELQGSLQSFNLNFGQGWEKFVADHELQVDDLLTFSLLAKSYFQVEVYDGGGCLKTSALDAEVAETKVVEAARPVAEVVLAAMYVAEISETEGVEKARSGGLDDSDSGDGLIKLGKSDQGELLPEHYVVRGNVLSRRRPVTVLETQQGLKTAEALELANPNILLVMSKQNVYKGFWLGFPKQFAKEWMPSENKEVTIVNKGGHSWPAKWIAGRGGLSAGWRRFSLDHRLEEHDVCVFELIDKANYVLLVHIFRILFCPGEDPGLCTPTLSPEKKNKKKSDKASPGDAAALSAGSGSEEQGENRAADGTPTAPQQVLASFGREGHESGCAPGEGSERKSKRSRRDVQVGMHTLQPYSAPKSLTHKRRLLEGEKASLATGKELTSSDHEGIGTSDAELLLSIVQKSVDQVFSKNKAGGAGDEVALIASGARDKVEPQQVLALICYDNGEPLGQKRSAYRNTERPSFAREDCFPAIHAINPDEVQEQFLHAPATGSCRGRKKEKRSIKLYISMGDGM